MLRLASSAPQHDISCPHDPSHPFFEADFHHLDKPSHHLHDPIHYYPPPPPLMALLQSWLDSTILYLIPKPTWYNRLLYGSQKIPATVQQCASCSRACPRRLFQAQGSHRPGKNCSRCRRWRRYEDKKARNGWVSAFEIEYSFVLWAGGIVLVALVALAAVMVQQRAAVSVVHEVEEDEGVGRIRIPRIVYTTITGGDQKVSVAAHTATITKTLQRN